MNYIPKFKRKVIRRILGALSFSGALFAFQACYGTPYDLDHVAFFEGKVIDASKGDAIKGIAVEISDGDATNTDSAGSFYGDAMIQDNYQFSFIDIDSTENGLYEQKDTIISLPDSVLLKDDLIIKLDPIKE